MFAKIPIFKTFESYNKTKQNFEIVFIGNTTEFPESFSAFKELAKDATLYRYIHLPQTKDIYYGMVNEALGNDTATFIPLPPLERYDEPAKPTWKSCKKREDGSSAAREPYDIVTNEEDGLRSWNEDQGSFVCHIREKEFEDEAKEAHRAERRKIGDKNQELRYF